MRNASDDELKQLSAALGTEGMTKMFHLSSSLSKKAEVEKVSVESSDIAQTIDRLCTSSASQPDLVFVGCPHCSVDELRQVARLVEGKRVKTGIECWICTSRHNKGKAREAVMTIENSGAHVLADMCTIVSWTETLGIKTIMTNSAKTAHYAPAMNKAETVLAPLKDCVKAAFAG